MRRSSSDLKALSREALNGQWGLPVAAYLLIFICSIILTLVITALLSPYSVLSIVTCQIMIYIVNLFVSLLQAGNMKMHLNINRKEAFELKDLILPFTMQPDRFLTVNLILLLAEVLPSLPLTVLSYRTETMESLFFSLAASLVQSLIGLILSLFFGLSPSGQSGDGSYRVPEDKFPSDERKQRQIFLYYPELYSSDYCLRLHLLYRPPLAGALYCQHYGSFLYGCNRRNRQSQTKRRTAHAGTAF